MKSIVRYITLLYYLNSDGFSDYSKEFRIVSHDVHTKEADVNASNTKQNDTAKKLLTSLLVPRISISPTDVLSIFMLFACMLDIAGSTCF